MLNPRFQFLCFLGLEMLNLCYEFVGSQKHVTEINPFNIQQAVEVLLLEFPFLGSKYTIKFKQD